MAIPAPVKAILRFWRKRINALAVIAIAVPSLSLLVAMLRLPWIRSLELVAYDVHCRNARKLPPDPRIEIVGMYDDSPEHVGEVAYPLAREKHARVVDELRVAGAKVIVFDVWFTAPALPESDRAFAAALKRAGNVMCALKADFHDKNGTEEIGFTEPEPTLNKYMPAGSIAVERSFGGRVRWYLPYPADFATDKRYLALPIAAAAAYNGDAGQTPTVRDHFRLGPIDAPIGSLGETLIRYAGPPETYKPVRYEDVYDGTWRTKYASDKFQGKIVLIGRVSSTEDKQDTPLGEMHGVEILANETQTALQNSAPIHISELGNFAIKLALCITLALVIWKFGIWAGVLFTFTASVAWGITADRLFAVKSIWADSVEPVAVLIISFVGMALLDNNRLRRTFARLMPAEDAGLLLREDADAPGATAEREVTVVFCDIRNYTGMSESLPATTVESLLHQFYTAGENAADRSRFDGDLDKFVGDEMMLRFETRRRKEPHALRAVRWAMAMQEFAAELDRSGAAGNIGFRVGIGISTGRVRVGTVSAQKRIQATVIGDAVNVASRLQNATKEIGRPILLGKNTFDMIAGAVPCEPLGEISVKGKQEPIAIYSPAIKEKTT